MSLETLLPVAFWVLTAAVVVVAVMGARLTLRARARSREINAQIERLDRRLDEVDRVQETLHEISQRLRQDLTESADRLTARFDERMDEVERVGLERYQSVVHELEGLHRDLDRLDHLGRHRAALDRAEATVARAVAQGRVAEDTGTRVLHHLAEVRRALLRQEPEEAVPVAAPVDTEAS